MIQRIQSLYLFLAIVLMVLTFVFPVWGFTVNGNTALLYNYGVDTQQPEFRAHVPYLIILSLTAILTIGLYGWAFCSFKKLGKAALLTVFALLATVGFLVILGLVVYDLQSAQNLSGNILQVGALVPVIAFVFGCLAFRAIRRDQALLRSADRIR